MYILTYILL